MDNIVIRNVTENDIPSIADIQINGWKTAYKGIIDDAFLNSVNLNEKTKFFKNTYKNGGFAAAELENEVVGFCRYFDNNDFSHDIQNVDCEITALYIKPDLKYNGIGTKLFRFVTDEFKIKNKTKMILWCLKDNEPSKKFYTKMGGRIIKERVIAIGESNYIEVGFIYDI